MTKKTRKILSMITALAMSASAFASLTIGAFAAAGDVTTNADIVFTNDTGAAINVAGTTYEGTVNSMVITANSQPDEILTDGNLAIGKSVATVTIPEEEYAGSKDTVEVKFDLAFGRLDKRTVNFYLKDAGGDNIAEFSFIPYNGTLTNSLGVTTDDLFYTNNTVIWERAVHFTITLDYLTRRITTNTSCLKGGASKPSTVASHEVTMTNTNPLASFVINSSYDNAGRRCEFNNLTIKTTEGDYSVESVEYTVNYVFDNETVKTVTGVGNVGGTPVVDKADIITDDMKYVYVSDDADGMEIADDGSTVVTVEVDGKKAVSSIGLEYIADGTEVLYTNETIASGYYEGDSYTYISHAYITGIDDKIYAVGEDYVNDTNSTILNGQPTPVNNALMQTFELTLDTVLTYSVAESPNAVYFDEWEDILNASGGNYGTGRYVASGGRMAATTAQVPFYTVPQTGNYQVIFAGGPMKRGTAVYKSAEAAAAAEAYNSETALLYLDPSVIDKSSTAYGIYAAKTALLTEGDVLTLRAYGTNNTSDNLDYVLIRHIVSGDIIGPDGISILPGGNSAQFTFDSGLSGEVTWTITDSEGGALEGVSIDENGVVTVSDEAEPGTFATITASMSGGAVTGTKEIEIDEPVVNGFEIEGPKAVAVGQTYEYKAKYVNDWYGQDISDYVDIWVESLDPDIVTASGNTITVIGTGTALITVHVGEDDSDDIEITANNYYLTGKADGNETAVDASALVESENIIGYLVTTAKGGVKVSQETVQTVPEVIDTTGADSYEIAPVYKYEDLGNLNGNKTPLGDSFVDGFYNMTFTKTYTQRVDIYVNDYMVGNNVDQDGTGRAMTDADKVYSINDVVVDGGSVTVSTTDIAGGSNGAQGYYISSVELVKAPSIVTRTPKVYVTGDSLVASYYGTPTTLVGSSRTGWGQVIDNYFTDDVEVVNMANSGSYAESLLATAIPGMLKMAQPGDWFIIESGYNDRTYSTREKMYDALVSMVDQAMAKDIKVVLVSPNASAHDYKTGLQFSSTMTDVANDMLAKYGSEVIYVDLTTLSYNFMVGTGIDTKAAEAAVNYAPVYNEDGTLASVTVTPVAEGGYVKMPHFIWTADMKPAQTSSDTVQVDATYNLSTAGGDTLHSSYVAAMKWAEVVAQGMYDADVEFIDTAFSYTFTDTIGNEITCQVK